jgi:AcrR family transcriptional regulator
VQQRRERLIEAGIDVFATEGFRNSSVRSICSAAELNQRYFYESFETREDLLIAVFERIVDSALLKTGAAVANADGPEQRVRAGLEAWWYSITSDPRHMRILALEITGVSERLEDARRKRRHAVAKIIESELVELAGDTPLRPGVDLALVAHSLIAAVIDPFIDWFRGESERTLDELIDFAAGLILETRASIFPGI